MERLENGLIEVNPMPTALSGVKSQLEVKCFLQEEETKI